MTEPQPRRAHHQCRYLDHRRAGQYRDRGERGRPVLTISESGDGISMALAVPGAPTVALDNLTTVSAGWAARLHIDDIPA